MLELTSKYTKYHKFNVNFMNKAILCPARVSDMMEEVQVDFEYLSS